MNPTEKVYLYLQYINNQEDDPTQRCWRTIFQTKPIAINCPEDEVKGLETLKKKIVKCIKQDVVDEFDCDYRIIRRRQITIDELLHTQSANSIETIEALISEAQKKQNKHA
jgi:hypothetical protein